MIVVTAGGARQLIVWTLQSVTSLDPATGKPYWREKFNSGGSRVRLIEPTYPWSGRKVAWSAPAFANRHVFARSDNELICASLAANAE